MGKYYFVIIRCKDCGKEFTGPNATNRCIDHYLKEHKRPEGEIKA